MLPVDTPGAALIRSKNVKRRTRRVLDPLARRSSWLTSVVAASTTGDSATTVIVSCCVLTFICTATSCVTPSATGMPVCVLVANPASSTEIS